MSTEPVTKDYAKFPKFRHNLWYLDESSPSSTLVVSHGTFEVDTEEAKRFMEMRTHCTGHNTVAEVARRSGHEESIVGATLESLAEAGIFHEAVRPVPTLGDDEIRQVLLSACDLWGSQLSATNIMHSIARGSLSRHAFIGWLLETYHYVRTFPQVVEVAVQHSEGELRALLSQYAREERGHERFILQCLNRAGLSESEVESSTPLVATRTIELLLREMWQVEPMSALLVAAIIEADEGVAGADEEIREFCRNVTSHYGVPPDTLDPLFEHGRIDAELGHATMAKRNAHLLTLRDRSNLHWLVNALHDLKHAFDLQALEIRHYYQTRMPGNYLPRQAVDFFAV